MPTPPKKTELGAGNTPTKRCIACEKSLPEPAQFCPYCQEPVAGSKPQASFRYCPGCGREAASDYQYCPACAVEIPDTIIPWHERVDQAKEEELEADLYICHQDKEVKLYYQDLLVQQEVQVRAIRRAEYAGSLMTATEWFDALYEITDDYNSAFVVYGLLSGNYPTIVCPYAPYNAIPLTKKVMLLSLIAQAMEKGYLLPDGKDPSPIVLGRYAPVVLQYYQHTKHITDEELATLRFKLHLGKLECWLAGKQADDYASLSPESFHTLRTLDRMYRALRDGVLSGVKDRQEKPISLLCGLYYLMLGSGTYHSHTSCQYCGGSGNLRTLTQPPAYKKAQQSGLVVAERTCPHCHSRVTPDIQFCSSCGGTIATQHDPAVVSSHDAQPGYCPLCRAVVRTPGARFCETCGAIRMSPLVEQSPTVYLPFCYCHACGKRAYKAHPFPSLPVYCEYCAALLQIPEPMGSDRAYCHTCGKPAYVTRQQHCLFCGAKLFSFSAIPQNKTLRSRQQSRIVESSIVSSALPALPAVAVSRKGHSPYYPCPCPKKANLCRSDAKWCIQCNRALSWGSQYAQELPAFRPRSPRRKE